MAYGRIYSIHDLWKRRFVYVGQTRVIGDRRPHGDKMGPAWSNPKHQGRYIYCFEREWEDVADDQLDRAEAQFIARRQTFLKHFPGGLNLTPGGNVAHQPFKIPLPPKPKPAKLRVLDPLVKEQRRTRILAIAAESRKNPKVIDKIRESMIRVNADTNMRELRQKASLKAFQDESVKSKHLAALRAYWDKRNLAA
jgi:hypothetical protein